MDVARLFRVERIAAGDLDGFRSIPGPYDFRCVFRFRRAGHEEIVDRECIALRLDTQVGWKALAGAAPADLFQRDRGSDSLPLASEGGYPQTLGVCDCAGAVARVSPCKVAFG